MLDQDRIRTILNAGHSYYGSRRATVRVDARLMPSGSGDYLMSQVSPTMRVLDIGCGSGETLLGHSDAFRAGIGIDTDSQHIRMADEAKRERGIENVEFLLLEFPREIERLQLQSFDVVFSQRGMDISLSSFQTAAGLLLPGGIVFCEEIGDEHLREVDEIFGSPADGNRTVRTVDLVRAAMESAGVSVRLAADVFSKWCYPDIYEWLLWQCSLWAWLGIPLPQPDDPRIERFAERAANATGEIETSHHVVWVAGVKG